MLLELPVSDTILKAQAHPTTLGNYRASSISFSLDYALPMIYYGSTYYCGIDDIVLTQLL